MIQRTAKIRPVSAKKRKQRTVTAKADAACRSRACGRCEAKIADVCKGWGNQVHHRRLRSQGGSLIHLDNLMWVCSDCHLHIHDNVAWSVEMGFILQRPQWMDELESKLRGTVRQ
jgi:predicted HNH restriction endonuclease